MTDEELGTMTQRHTRARDSVASAHKDRGVLLTEVERLRGEAERERAAVVAYLRGLADDYGVCIDLSLAEQADKIESGEHRREESE
jgi:hypothetical protein